MLTYPSSLPTEAFQSPHPLASLLTQARCTRASRRLEPLNPASGAIYDTRRTTTARTPGNDAALVHKHGLERAMSEQITYA